MNCHVCLLDEIKIYCKRLLKATMMILLVKAAHTPLALQMATPKASARPFWSWLNAVFNKVDYDRIKKVGPDRAASEWLLRCGAKVRYQGFDRWQQDYNGLPTGPLGRYKIEAIDATESCIMYRGFDHLDGLKYLEEIRFNKCVYIEDTCLERLSKIENLQCSLRKMELISCGNVTDRGIIALHKLRSQMKAEENQHKLERIMYLPH
uniref:Distal membrane arm assembly component 2 like n=1 Tax=Paramormyrops kingsleyae TaxID=1676925 RepID=A0A3B3SMM0_9TELE